MKTKMKKILAAVMAVALSLIGFAGNGSPAYAESVSIRCLEPEVIDLEPGETEHVKLPIRASAGSYLYLPVIVAEAGDAPFTISQPVLSDLNLNTVPTVITEYGTLYVEFDIKVKETATIGNYPFQLKFTGYDVMNEQVTTSLTINTQILKEKIPAQLSIDTLAVKDAAIGNNTVISFVVKNEGEITARNAFVSVSYNDTGIVADYPSKTRKIGDIEPGKEQLVSLPVRILPTATVGLKTLGVNLSYKDDEGTQIEDSNEIYVTVGKNESAPQLEFQDITYSKSVKAGEKFVLTATIDNFGEETAENVTIAVDPSSISTESFLKDYYTDVIELKDIKPDGVIEVEIPLIVSKQATGGLKALKVVVNFSDEAGVPYTMNSTIYPEITAEGAASDGKHSINISNVKQSPAQPVAGEKLDISFDFENKSAIDITELKIYPGYSGNTFIPINSEPYQYIEKIKGGETKRITIPLIVSENIIEGFNNLTVEFKYSGGGADSVVIPVKDVKNDLGSSSMPKLIVSKYITDVAELKAGSTFNFTFDVYNSHSTVNAKNITVTVTQAENIFSVTQGSNSFFINKIAPGETVQESLELKIKSDAKTNAYKLNIKIEYEYDGIEPNPETGKIGETKEYDLNLQVVENARPVVDYVNVYSFDGNVIVGSPAFLSFEFYNMGKSQLNNVIATVEGDFAKSDGNMFFVGNVMEGSSSYVEFEVIPNIEGMAKGVVKITYEDSNGDEVVFNKEFETMVMGAQVWDPGMGDGGMDVFNPTLPEAKKAILPVWAFIILEIVIFIAFVPITRKSIITVYRKKLRKKEEENY